MRMIKIYDVDSFATKNARILPPNTRLKSRVCGGHTIKGYKQTGIVDKQFKSRQVFVRGQAGTGIVGLIGNQHGLGTVYFRKQFQNAIGTVIFQNAGYLIAGWAFVKLSRNSIKEHRDSIGWINLFEIIVLMAKASCFYGALDKSTYILTKRNHGL